MNVLNARSDHGQLARIADSSRKIAKKLSRYERAYLLCSCSFASKRALNAYA